MQNSDYVSYADPKGKEVTLGLIRHQDGSIDLHLQTQSRRRHHETLLEDCPSEVLIALRDLMDKFIKETP